MSDKPTHRQDGCQPVKKGYQPSRSSDRYSEDPVEGGYQPTRSSGDNPTNNPPQED